MTERFNTLAKEWDKSPFRMDYSQAISQYVSQHLPQTNSLHAAEVGAGTGMLSVLLSECFDKIDLIDSSKGMIDEIEKKVADFGLEQLNPLHVALESYTPDRAYDVVYSAMFLHHVIETDLVIIKFADMQESGGKLFLCDLYSEDGRFHPSTVEGVYHHGFDPDILANKLKVAGYDINNIETVYNFTKNDRLYPMFIIECTKL